jgi:hypothetical protein
LAAVENAPAAFLTPEAIQPGLRGRGYRVTLQRKLTAAYFRGMAGFIRRFGVGPAVIFPAPFALLDAWRRRVDLPKLERLRAALPEAYRRGISTRTHYLRMIWNWYIGGMALVMYPQLGEPAWKDRFTVRGTPPWELPSWGRQPVVLTFLHSGAFHVLPFWLRSRGIPAAFMLGGLPMMLETGAFRAMRDDGDGRAGLKDIPLTFARRGAGLRDALRFLVPGHVLCMALDGGRMLPEDKCDAGGFPFHAKHGASRIAAQTGAILMPVSIRRTRGVRFEITFGEPVAPDMLADPAATTQQLVQTLWSNLKEHPTDLYWTALESASPELRVDRCDWL